MENCSLLGGSNQFTLLVGVLAAVLTLAILTNRLVDKIHKYKVKSNWEALRNAKRNIMHLSRVTVFQLSIAAAISLRIFLTTLFKQSAFWWFDQAIIAILIVTFIYWIWIHTLYFRKWYNWRLRIVG